jgi:deoxyinosine 3'endonuclease (endonuclease V)
MTGPCTCLSLPRLTFSCSDILENVVQPVCAMMRSAPGRAHVASNKIEFKYLNGNLMFPEIHPLTLVLERNSRKPDPSLQL